MRKMTTLKQCVVALAVVLNALGALIALTFQIPIYLDSIGTVFVGSLLGPMYGAVTGLLSGLLSGLTFDVYSLYYIPAQIFTGYMAGVIYSKTRCMEGKAFPLGVLGISIPTSIVSAIVTAFVFSGFTSSNSTYLVMVMNKMGIGLTMSCFIVQALTDFLDEMVALVISRKLLKSMSSDMKTKIRGTNRL